MKLMHGHAPGDHGELRVHHCLNSERFFLHFSLQGVLPAYQAEMRYDREVRRFIREQKERYTIIFHNLTRNIPEKPNFTKVFIYIVQYFPDNVRRDLDNRERKFVCDSLRAALLSPDDNWRNISICESGELDEGNPHTEIFVGDHRDAIEIFSYVQNFCISPASDSLYQSLPEKNHIWD